MATPPQSASNSTVAMAPSASILKIRKMMEKIHAEEKEKRRLNRLNKQKTKPPSESPKPPKPAATATNHHGCSPDKPQCRPVIIHLPDELFDDPSSGDEDDDELDESSSSSSSSGGSGGEEEDDEDADDERVLRRLLPQPLHRNGRITLKVEDPNLRYLLQSIADRFQPGLPDMLDRMIAMFNSGRCLGPEGEAQMRKLRAQQRRRLRRRLRRSVDPDWTPERRSMSMAECFRNLGRILGGGGSDQADLAGRVVNGHAELESLPSPPNSPPMSVENPPALSASLPLDTADGEYPDEDLAIALPSPTLSPSPPGSPSPPPQQQQPSELRRDITEESLESLMPESESHLVGVLLGRLRLPQATRYCLAEAEPPPERRWLRHCARQSRLRRDWDRRLADSVGDMLQQRLCAVLYDPQVCSRLTIQLASDLLELVTRELDSEFKVIGLLSIGSVTEIDRMAMVTRSAHTPGVDCCRAFHYQNESVFAVFTCHLLQRFHRLALNEAPLDIDDPEETGATSGATAAAEVDASAQLEGTS